MLRVSRLFLTGGSSPYPPRPGDSRREPWRSREWPCRWVGCEDAGESPFVAAYRCRFSLPHPLRMRAHVSGDERYRLFCDGEEIAQGPERGSPDAWFYDDYELSFEAGEHLLVAEVWSLGPHAPRAQMSVCHGFLFSPEDEAHLEIAGTGRARWECKRLSGLSFERPFMHDFYSRGSNVILDGREFPWGFENGGGDGWNPARDLHPGVSADFANRYGAVHLLVPSTLPAMHRERFGGRVRIVGEDADDGPIAGESTVPAAEVEHWGRLAAAGGEAALTIGAQTRRRVLWDFEEYRCGTARVTVSGGRGACLRLHWAESLYREPAATTKGNRDEVAGKYFVGVGDTLIADGGERRVWEGIGLQAGRYLQLEVRTDADALMIHALELRESRFPLEMESEFLASEPRLANVTRMAFRSLQSCCHDAYVDGPYYEQMTWIGDSRLKALVTYVVSSDDRLARKALLTFDRSRLTSGFTRARWPARDTMIIAPYSLWWVGMVHDFALWRGDPAFVRRLMPGVRAVLEAFGSHEDADGLIRSPAGWNFVDWIPGWCSGIPPGGDGGISAVLNWQYALTLENAARVEEWLGEKLLSARLREAAVRLAEKLVPAFWVEARGLFADDLEGRHFSEHTQSLAVLSGQLDCGRSRRMLEQLSKSDDNDVSEATIYFSHYLLEAYAALGMGKEVFRRLEAWFAYEQIGLKTLPESPEPSRSDCHGWGAHVLYHCFATLLGIRPEAMGFDRVRIAPLACGIGNLSGSLIHPRGRIRVELAWDGDDQLAHRRISLPEGMESGIAPGDNGRPSG